MRKFFATILDALFPPSEDALLVRELPEATLSLLFSPVLLDDISALARFHDARVRALIHEAKFHRNERAFKLLSHLVERYLDEHLGEFDALVPVPLSCRRLRERGYNQVLCVLEARSLPIPVLSRALTRARHTTPQTEIGRDARLKNVVGAFAIADPGAIVGKRILLLDDVTTTGATLAEARVALLTASPASVTCVALAH